MSCSRRRPDFQYHATPVVQGLVSAVIHDPPNPLEPGIHVTLTLARHCSVSTSSQAIFDGRIYVCRMSPRPRGLGRLNAGFPVQTSSLLPPQHPTRSVRRSPSITVPKTHVGRKGNVWDRAISAPKVASISVSHLFHQLGLGRHNETCKDHLPRPSSLPKRGARTSTCDGRSLSFLHQRSQKFDMRQLHVCSKDLNVRKCVKRAGVSSSLSFNASDRNMPTRPILARGAGSCLQGRLEAL